MNTSIFIDTHEARNRAILEAIISILKNTREERPISMTAIAESLRTMLPYTVTVQKVTGIIHYAFKQKRLKAPLVCYARGSLLYLNPALVNEI